MRFHVKTHMLTHYSTILKKRKFYFFKTSLKKALILKDFSDSFHVKTRKHIDLVVSFYFYDITGCKTVRFHVKTIVCARTHNFFLHMRPRLQYLISFHSDLLSSVMLTFSRENSRETVRFHVKTVKQQLYFTRLLLLQLSLNDTGRQTSESYW